MKPSDLYPPGSFSRHTPGSALNTQYGAESQPPDAAANRPARKSFASLEKEPERLFPAGELLPEQAGRGFDTPYGGRVPPTGRSSDTPGSLPIDPYLKWSMASSYASG